MHDRRYGIPWIGLYTGVRFGEIAQLLTEAVRELHGVWIFHITREFSILKSTKSAGSLRVVPIHSELVDLGLLDYHRTMVARGEKQLFAEIELDQRGFFRSAVWVLQCLFAQNRSEDRQLGQFHGFRHGIADAFRQAGYLNEQFGMLLAHTKETTTGTLRNCAQGILSARVKLVKSVRFPELRRAG